MNQDFIRLMYEGIYLDCYVRIHYMFNTREYPRDHCGRPLVFFLDSVGSDGSRGTWSNYTRHSVEDCHRAESVKHLKQVRVLSHKLEIDVEQMKAPHRQCCDISPLYKESMVVIIRQCMEDELIAMKS